MNKIKFDFTPKKNKIIKIGNDKVEIKPYIPSKDILSINTLCLKQFSEQDNLAECLTTIKYVFDMFVINQCTNIQIDGIILNEKDGKSNIEIDITSDAIEKFDSSQIMEKIAPHILNYDEVYNGVKFLIELQNVQKAFGTMGNLIPSIDNMGNVIGTSLKSLTEFKDKDPETFNKIIEQALVKDVVKEKREDIKEIKKAKKTTKTTNV